MISVFNRVLDLIGFLTTTIVIALGGYVVFDSFMVTQSAVLGDEIMQYAPAEEGPNFNELHGINQQIVGWIIISDTSINYPVLQSGDNDYYLSRNYLNEFATAGSIFMDYRNDILRDDFLIIYGHRMSYGKMFSDVIKYADEKYFQEHRTGKLYYEDGVYDLRVVGFSKINADTKDVYGRVSLDALNELRKNAWHWRDENGEKYVMLSTCDAKDKSVRDVLLLKMV